MSVNMTYITENKMQVKNISARGWWIMGTMVAPGETKDVEATKADIGDNPDLEIISDTEEVVEQSEEKRKPGRPAK